MPCAPPSKSPVDDEHAHQLGDGDGRHAEVVAGEPQRRHADHRGDAARDQQHAERRAGDRRPAEMGIDHDRGIGAGAEEHRMADRDLAGIAADDVPGRGADRRQQHQRAEPLVDRRARDQQRIGQREHAAARPGGGSAASCLAHQALRPEPQHQHEQDVDDHVLVDRADQIGRQRFDRRR